MEKRGLVSSLHAGTMVRATRHILRTAFGSDDLRGYKRRGPLADTSGLDIVALRHIHGTRARVQ